MATAAICGTTGTVSGGTEVISWTVTKTQEAVEATSMASGGFKERIPCLIGATFSFTAIGAKPTMGAASGQFKTASAGGATISGAIIINKVSVETPVEGVVTFTAEGVFTGAVSVA